MTLTAESIGASTVNAYETAQAYGITGTNAECVAALKAIQRHARNAYITGGPGRDIQCAERCSAIAPQVYRECRLRWNRLVALYPTLSVAASVKAKIDAAAQFSAVVQEIVLSLRADSQDPCDIGHPTVRALLTAPTNQGGIGLTQDEAAPLLAAGRQPQTITANEVSQCRQ